MDHFSSWRIAYAIWAGELFSHSKKRCLLSLIGLQLVAALLAYGCLPDYPVKAPQPYLETMWSMLNMLVTEPILVQLSLAAMTILKFILSAS